jgi:hypothetical protein
MIMMMMISIIIVIIIKTLTIDYMMITIVDNDNWVGDKKVSQPEVFLNLDFTPVSIMIMMMMISIIIMMIMIKALTIDYMIITIVDNDN